MDFKPLKSIDNKGKITILPEGKYEYALLSDDSGVVIIPTGDEELKKALEGVIG